jgi:hypothetical protein
MPREQEVIRVSKAEFACATVEFAKHIKARVVEGRVAPPGGCLRSAD